MSKYIIRGWDNVDCRDRGTNQGEIFSFVMDADNEDAVLAYCDFISEYGNAYEDLEDITEEAAMKRIREEFESDPEYLKEFMARDHQEGMASSDDGMGYPIVFTVSLDDEIIYDGYYDESMFIDEDDDWDDDDWDDEDEN